MSALHKLERGQSHLQKHALQLGGLERALGFEPPGKQLEKSTAHEMQQRFFGMALGGKARQVFADEIQHQLSKALQYQLSTAFPDQGQEQSVVLSCVLEHAQDEAEGLRRRAGHGRELRAKHLAEIGEASHQQLFLVGEVHVEGRPSHVGVSAEVLDGEPVPAALQDEGDEALAQGTASSLHTSVTLVWLFAAHDCLVVVSLLNS